MKTLLMSMVAITSLAMLWAVPSGTIELIDLQGRKITAEILSGNQDTAMIRRTKGSESKDYSLDLKTLSEASREYVLAELARIEAEKPKGVMVSSLIVKRVKASPLGGTFRYFFDIRNYGPEAFAGSVEITLNNSQKGVRNGKDVFTMTQPLHVNLGTTQSIDAHTGPREIHGDWSVAGYSWKVMVDGKQVGSGSGDISAKYEDLTGE
jgi:hypothetical protein